jgi:hypothetical protein
MMPPPLRVYDEQERELGFETIKAGDDAEAAARRVLREKHGKHVRFYGRRGRYCRQHPKL